MNGRHPDGTFAEGNPGGPGRPRRAVEAGYLHAVRAACPEGEWEAIIRRAVEAAKKGDGRARDFLGRILLPDPAGLAEDEARRDLNLGAWQRVIETGLTPEELQTMEQIHAKVMAVRHNLAGGADARGEIDASPWEGDGDGPIEETEGES